MSGFKGVESKQCHSLGALRRELRINFRAVFF
jgi:hypothetical protein